MGPILEFVPRCSRHSQSRGEGPQCFSKCREEVEAALASKPEVALPHREVTAPAPRSSTKPVGNGTKPVGHAGRQAKWRAQHPEQHRDQMRAIRAKRKAGKAVGW